MRAAVLASLLFVAFLFIDSTIHFLTRPPGYFPDFSRHPLSHFTLPFNHDQRIKELKSGFARLQFFFSAL
jgi:hypothetical protein